MSNLKVIPGGAGTQELNFAAFGDRIPPQNLEIEEVVLGGILIDPDALNRVKEQLLPQMFYMGAHQEIYRSMLALQGQGMPTDLMSVCNWMRDRGLLDKVGGPGKLLELLDRTVSAVNIDAHAALVVEKYRRRLLIQVGNRIAHLGYDNSVTLDEILEQSQQDIFGLTESSLQRGLQPIGELISKEAEKVQARQAGELPIATPTGFYDLDAMFGGGVRGEQLIVIAGRPSMGKSAFAANICRNIAMQGESVAIFSLEMSGGQVASRLWSAEASVPVTQLRNGHVNQDEWYELGQSMGRLVETALFVDDSEDISPSHVLSQCQVLKAKHGGLGAVMVDYLHLMLDEEENAQAIAKITRAFKKMSRALDAPIFLLSQLSRAVESRQNKRPLPSDLRASGAIEQDADLVMLLYRDEYYNPDTPDRGIAEVIVAKQRDGATGTVKLLFEPQFTRFRNMARRF